MSRQRGKPNIFISYRRSDSQDVTGRLFDHLVRKYSRDSVFKDVDSIAPSQDFHGAIRRAIAAADVALVVIGPDWIHATDQDGRRRLDNPEDLVRLEIEETQRAGVPLIPLIVRNGTMPEASQLPESIKPLALLHALNLRPDPDFRNDMSRLIAAIERLTRAQDPLRRVLQAACIGVAALAAIVVPVSLMRWPNGGSVAPRIPSNPPQSDEPPSGQGRPGTTATPKEPTRTFDELAVPPGSPLPEAPSAHTPADAKKAKTQVFFLDPDGMQIGWLTRSGPSGDRVYLPGQLTVPARYSFDQGYIYRLKLTNIPGRPWAALYPTIEVASTTPTTEAYLTHNVIPISFTSEDFDQVLDGGNFVTKVFHLPDPNVPDRAVSRAATLASTRSEAGRTNAPAHQPGDGDEAQVSTRSDPEIDPVHEAAKRGTLLVILRLGAIDMEMPGGGSVLNGEATSPPGFIPHAPAARETAIPADPAKVKPSPSGP